MKILIVCMGNICRSPMAQCVMTHLAKQAGLSGKVQIDSAGTHASHVGETPDARAKTSLTARGYSLGKGRSRRIVDQDFGRFDLILAMDLSNLKDLKRTCPVEHAHKLHLFLEFAGLTGPQEVPDPYFGNAEGFERILDLCEAGARGLLQRLHSLPV